MNGSGGYQLNDNAEHRQALGFLPFQRAFAALRATSERFSGVSFLSLAFAPRFPSETAAAFFFFAIHYMLGVQRKGCKAGPGLTC